MLRSSRSVSAAVALTTWIVAASFAYPSFAAAQGRDSLAPFVPTPQDVVDRMLELAGVTRDDVVYDLGCGDGRIVITAAQRYGARGVGVDIDPQRIAESKANAEREGVADLVEFVQQDALTVDVSDATVVTLYLLSSSNMKLRPLLTSQLLPGARIVSHAFSMGNWQADPGRALHRRPRQHPDALSVATRRHRQTLVHFRHVMIAR